MESNRKFRFDRPEVMLRAVLWYSMDNDEL